MTLPSLSLEGIAKALIVLLNGRNESNWRRPLSQLSFWFIFPLTLTRRARAPILIAFIINNFTIKYYQRKPKTHWRRQCGGEERGGRTGGKSGSARQLPVGAA